jgi:hypothetical protein
VGVLGVIAQEVVVVVVYTHLDLEETVVPELSSSLILHKYSKNIKWA